MTDLFTSNDTDKVELDENKDYLAELVGEGKKYKDVAALAKANAHGSATIDLLTRKMDDLRKDYLKVYEDNTAKAKLQELIDRLDTSKLNDNQENTSNSEDVKSGLTKDEAKSLFSEFYTENKKLEREDNNFDSVKKKLEERYGHNAQKFLGEQMQTLGLSKEDINDMARKQPQVLIKALGLDKEPQRESFNAPPRSAVRNDNFAPSGGQKRTWSYYQELKKSNPTLYHDPKINVQMQKDMFELGDAFMDGDFYN